VGADHSAPVPFTPAAITSVVVFVLIVAAVLAAFTAAVRRAYARLSQAVRSQAD
jgi:hypothetical protein